MGGHLQLGLFLPSTSGGMIIADATPPQNKPTWQLNKNAVVAAEAGGFEFALSQVKWRGFGGPSGHWDSALESFTLMSALAAVTDRIRLYASVAVRTIHPAILAKMAATIDEVSGGRFGVNIVAGWNKFEYAQMGLWQDDNYFIDRYEYAAEYLTILQRLWSEPSVTFDGKHFQLQDCVSLPKPAQRLSIVCAGQSEGALDFVAREADYAFVGRLNDSPEQLRSVTKALRDRAAGRDRAVGAYSLLTVIADETADIALARKQSYIDRRDDVAIAEFLRASGKDINRADYAKLDPAVATFMSIPSIASSYAGVAAHLDALAEADLSGVCLSFPDFSTDVPIFIERILPLMKSRSHPM
ncbi:LLM class flavin-dependent oxidoreductase [Acidisoma cellulosilytica]|uniref:LLM class flavin-dependent oxidoreductase n=1 Tax=Acidisoma cellulosilyticum TaxID=2802395 RepID=A0A963Z2M8_9PROT|nr:LLM class flavin-dependent oxidoreductase [Acidisoma cellulosilyticum]MCB8881409.1 LLM class flavin-dependent oxidoreductase [Acidisoma cellulosilyticum]